MSDSPGAVRNFGFGVQSLAKALFFFPCRDLSGGVQSLIVSGWTLDHRMFLSAIVVPILASRANLRMTSV
jgi:hypothetical protein